MPLLLYTQTCKVLKELRYNIHNYIVIVMKLLKLLSFFMNLSGFSKGQSSYCPEYLLQQSRWHKSALIP